MNIRKIFEEAFAPSTKQEIFDEMQEAGFFNKDEFSFTVGTEEEKEASKEIVYEMGYECEISGDDRDIPYGGMLRYHFECFKPKKQTLEAFEGLETDTVDEDAVNNGINDMIINAIQGEWSTVEQYRSYALTANESNRPDVVKVFEDLIKEELVHIGQLEALMATVVDGMSAIDDGKEETEEILNQPNLD